MRKDIKAKVEHYASLPYQIVIEKWDDGRGPYYVARMLEFPDCMMTGKTPEEALKELESVKREWIETNLELGNTMPEPLSTRKYSGNIVLRIPASLHEALARAARIEGISLNQYMVSVLSGAIGRNEVLVNERKACYRRKTI